MPKLYTVDRRGTLREGMVLDLVRFTDISPRELQLHLDNMFPQGVSCHGNNYFLSNGSHGVVVSPMIELLFEYVRRACYPDRPSRFTSWFGVESVDDAKRFRERYGGGMGAIFEVQADGIFRANMGLLRIDRTVLTCSFYAHCYWQSQPGPKGVEQFWEVLMVPPIRVIGRIEEAA
jgi:hypothetical protein